MRKLGEAQIERAVNEYAKAKGCMVKKMQTGLGGSSGWPDRMYICNGKVWFIEFKAPGKKPTELQKARIHELQQHRIHVYVIDEVELGKEAIDHECNAR